MVQVDVFWSYGLGSTLSVAASRQLLAHRRARLSRLADPQLLVTLLFLALVFAPSGLYLVWNFPSWETMHVGDRNIPAWLVTAFAITNVTQGLLGYLVVERLLARGRTYLAYLQIVAAYFAMFFVLVHGWDGKGYQRFFSPTHADFLHWHGDWSSWLTSSVAVTLYVMGAVLLPVLLVLAARWHTRGYAFGPAPARRPGAPAVAALMLATVFGGGLGLAVGAHLLLAWFGTALGVVLALALAAGWVAPGGPVHRLYRRLGLPDAGPVHAPEAQTAAGRVVQTA
ncbi:MAG: hypothetical protein ACJ76Z_16305 [Thermoleophilaceae bacterium]